MPPAYVTGQQVINTAATANPTTAALPSGTTVGNLLVAVSVNDSGTVNYLTGMSDSKGNTWAKARSYKPGSQDLEIWYAPITTGGTGHTVSFGFSLSGASNISWLVREYSGVDPATPFDVAGGDATGTSTSPLTASFSPAAAGSLVVVGLCHTTTTTTYTAGSGYSDAAGGGGGAVWVASEWRSTAASGAQTAGMTLGASRLWGVTAAVFKPVPVATYTGRPRPRPATLRM